jgi:hypothetical protein
VTSPRVVALLATFNEERFVASCIEHLVRHGVSVYLIDNESTDRTLELAERQLGRGLIGLETLPRDGTFSLGSILRRKQELAGTLEADWFMHHDADEVRLPPRSTQTLAGALAELDAQGYNAANFFEFTFVPTAEEPDHDHPRFQETMRSYYPYQPRFPNRLNAWKAQPGPVDLIGTAGHRVEFPGLRMWPESFPMRHYHFLSRAHARVKYGGRVRTADEERRGWGGWRSAVAAYAATAPDDLLPLPHASELREYETDDTLDTSSPLTKHLWAERWAERLASWRGVSGAE